MIPDQSQNQTLTTSEFGYLVKYEGGRQMKLDAGSEFKVGDEWIRNPDRNQNVESNQI